MGIFSAFAGKKTEKRSSSGIPDFLVSAGASSSGIAVNETSALSLSAFWACVEKISSTMCIFPFKIYENGKNGKEELKNHPIARLFSHSPNGEMTAYDFKYLMASNMLTFGAGIAEIEFKGGFPIALHPIDPQKVEPVKNRETGRLTYKVNQVNGVPIIKQPHELLIFRFWPTIDGGWLNPIKIHRETLGAALATRTYAATVFSQGVNPAGVISGIEDGLTEESEESLRQRFSSYAGMGSSHRLMLLKSNEKFDRIGVPPQDSMFIEARKFDISECSRIFGIPIHMLGVTDGSSMWGTGVEQMNLLFVSSVMSKHVKRWEEEINLKLISVDNENQFGKFVMDGLLRGNQKDRMEAYEKGSRIGLYNINEIRALEDREPIKNGDERLVPMNFQTLTKAVAGPLDKENKNG
jgi:HK97 family phage portal protein